MTYLHGNALVAAARAQIGQRKYSSMCQAFCVLTARIGAKGDFDGDRDADAVDGWRKAVKRGKVVHARDIKSLNDIPAGTIAYWTGGSRGFGHAAITSGRGRIISTDAPSWGVIGEVDLGYIARTWGNGLKFVGYIIDDGDGHVMVDNESDSDPIGKWEMVNHGAATVALKRLGAMVKWLLRRKRLVIITRDKNPDVLGGLECGGGGAWHYISTKYRSFGQVLVVVAGGRALWRNSKTTGPAVAKGIFKPMAHDGDTKEVPWFVGPVNGARMLTGLAHLDPDAPASFNVRAVDQILDFLEAQADRHGVGRSQIVLMIDTADKTGAVRKRVVARGYGSVFTEADKTDNAHLASMTYYRRPVKGSSVDDIVVWVGDGKPGKGPDEPRPVKVASKTPGTKPTDLDHLVLAAVLERQ